MKIKYFSTIDDMNSMVSLLCNVKLHKSQSNIRTLTSQLCGTEIIFDNTDTDRLHNMLSALRLNNIFIECHFAVDN